MTAFFVVWHLSSNHRADLGSIQTAAAPNPLLLYRPWGRHDDNPVGIAIPPRFQQQRNIQDGKGFSS